MPSEADPPTDPFAHAMALDAADIPRLVRAALAERRTALAYQPVIVAKTGTTVFHEGLIRLHDGAGRLLPARHFLPGVEETELGRDLDRAALRDIISKYVIPTLAAFQPHVTYKDDFARDSIPLGPKRLRGVLAPNQLKRAQRRYLAQSQAGCRNIFL